MERVYGRLQGQLNICNKEYCDFVVYEGGTIAVECIVGDKHLWQGKNFYTACILPEIADPRIPRGMRVREPLFITTAQNTLVKRK
ncbi:hypothetical protein PR048_014955, partial [Dryococelus australis]